MDFQDINSDSRREFLRKASAGAIALSAASYSRVMGANDRIHLGLIGCGDRGQHVMGEFQHRPEIQVTAVPLTPTVP